MMQFFVNILYLYFSYYYIFVVIYGLTACFNIGNSPKVVDGNVL